MRQARHSYSPLQTRRVLSGCVALASICHAQSVSWIYHPSAPAVVGMLAFDEVRQEILCHGDGVAGAETWRWDGTRWSRAWAAHPLHTIPASYSGLAFDPVRREVIVYGGHTHQGTMALTTWSWDGTDWRELARSSQPTWRRDPQMCLDRARRNVVLFGGWLGGGIHLADTWLWDGSDWHPAQPQQSPDPQSYARSLAYDEVRQRVSLVQFGTPDVWEWDGSEWSRVAGGFLCCPPSRAAFDPIRGRLMMLTASPYCGAGGIAEWLGDRWRGFRNVHPQGRGTPWTAWSGLAYDAARQQLVTLSPDCHGGYETAVLPSVQAQAATETYGSACSWEGLAPTLEPGQFSAPRIGESLAVHFRYRPSRSGALLLGLSDRSLGGVPLPLDLTTLGLPGCWLLQSADLAYDFTTPWSDDRREYPWAIPFTLDLLGARFYLQGLVLEPPANTLGALTSAGMAVTIGL